MSEIKIKCPTCGKVLRLLDAPNINAGTVTCPVCKEKHVVGKCQRYYPPGEKTCYGTGNPQQADADKTRIGSGAIQNGGDKTLIGSAPNVKTGTLSNKTGRTYQLGMGINTIGRKAASSTASVQIVTDDRTMSRSHAIIEVNNAGGKTIHILKNGANKNPSYLNGIVIDTQDQLILNNGDRIRMGNTELTFKI